MWGRWAWALAAVVAAGALVRLWGLGRQSLWVDEIITLKTASVGGRFGISDFFGTIQGPLHALLIHWISRLSTSEAALRSVSAVAGIATIPVVAEIGRRMFDRRTGFIAALLFAVSPYSVWYSQEVRNYSLLILAAAVALLAVWRIAHERRGWLGGYAGSTLAALYLNMSAVFMAVGQGLYLLVRLASRRRRLAGWLVAAAIVVALFVPGMLSVVGWAESGGVDEHVGLVTEAEPGELLRGETTFTPAALPYAFFAMAYGYSLGPSLTELHVGSPAAAFLEHLPVVLPAGLLLLAACCLGLLRLWGRRDAAALLLVTLLVPALGAIVLALANVKPFNVRYLSPGFPALILVIAAGVGMLRRRAAALLCAGLVVLCGLSLRNYHVDAAYGREDVRSAVEFVEEREEPGDVILVPVVRDVFRHYYDGPAELVVLYPAQTGSDEEVARRLGELLGGARRVWFIDSRWWHVDPQRRIPEYLGQVYSSSERVVYPGVAVRLFEMRREPAARTAVEDSHGNE
jgi:4-amino-4-deoxy-L-arabinose transferase-like glycosyltransferase